ncbi:MAG: hypothetical protein ACK4TA_01625 [Saprospiraceae bacterium]
MTKFKSFLYLLAVVFLVSSCKDESLIPVPEFETAVHGYAKLTATSALNFTPGDKTKVIDVDYQWVSIDGANTVNKIDLFVRFREAYRDKEGNPRTADHGIKKLRTIEGGAVPGNRTNTNFKISQDDVFNLFKDAKFNYGNGEVNVFADASRTTAAPFKTSDTFVLSWALTTADGRYFDSWSTSTCTEFETYKGAKVNNGGFNCFVNWGVK